MNPRNVTLLRKQWEAEWEEALATFSRFTKLTPPHYATSGREAKRQGLTDSFAMIRLVDKTIVINLEEIQTSKLEDCARVILAHEIGHHVYAPGDLNDNARLMARIRRGLPTRESGAAMIANLYTDLLINDRLQRSAGLDVAEVYRRLKPAHSDRLFTLYLRIYEVLWNLAPNTLVDCPKDEELHSDAILGARLIRAYSKAWLSGAGRFACLFLPYLLELPEEPASPFIWFDTVCASTGAELPDGLSQLDDDELAGNIHPAEDPSLSGLHKEPGHSTDSRETVGGQKNQIRDVTEYVALMKSIGVQVDEKQMVMRYYRELAVPHLLPFPSVVLPHAVDPLPEGLDPWDLGAPMAQLDWVASLTYSPIVIPGMTTLERAYGTSDGGEPHRTPLDLYVGIDCSGSMSNPACKLSYPVLAGSIVSLSALRRGAKVMACLSGEPGEHSETDGFVRSEKEILRILTGYLGTGSSFGIERLRKTFLTAPPWDNMIHILVVSDGDLFWMLDGVKDGWEVAKEAAARARGGATAVLEVTPASYAGQIARLASIGYDVHCLADRASLVDFARAFSRRHYQSRGGAS